MGKGLKFDCLYLSTDLEKKLTIWIPEREEKLEVKVPPEDQAKNVNTKRLSKPMQGCCSGFTAKE